jgi:hypothetical protein
LHAREEELMARESHRAAGQQALPVRAIFQRVLLRRKRTRAKRLRFLAAKATLPVRMIRPAWKLAHEYGPGVAAETGLSVRRQILDIWALSTRHWITPAHYYLYRLHDAENRTRVAHYLHHDEISRLVMELYPGKRLPSQRLRDKSAFYEACSQSGLPTVPILAEFSSGEMKRWYGPGPVRLPPHDLFSKPACGSFGVGAKSWRFDGAGQYQGVDGRSYSEQEVIRHLCALSEKTRILLQPRVENHLDLSAASAGGLCTARVVTIRWPDGTPKHLISTLRMPFDDSPVDNFSQGNLAAPIDPHSGRLGRAVRRPPEYGRAVFRDHPHTRERLEGRAIPFWSDALQICLRAQQVFSEFVTIGWDVAFTREGPVLIEGNHAWGTDVIQIPHNLPIGLTEFSRFYRAHIERSYP